MPRSWGIIGKALGAVGRLFSGKEAPSVPAESPSPPERERGRGAPPRRTLDSQLRGTYQDVTGTTTGYLDYRELFDNYSFIYDDEEKLEYFDMFLRAFYLNRDAPGSVSRDEFWRQSGVPKSAFDWEEWREVRGYSTR